MAHIDHELQRLERDAIRTASRTGNAMAIFNLNRAGKRLLVIRAADSFPGENRLYAGPFEPRPRWQVEFPDYPADAIPALGDGWSDTSWQNEACPSFLHEESGVVLWCDWPDAAQRELPDNPHYSLVQIATRHPSLGWQYGDGDRDVLRADTLGEVRDVLDSLADGASMACALQSARMRLNQLTADDSRQLWGDELEFGYNGGRACPDLIGAMREQCEREGALTLDGQPAKIFGVGSRFGFVCRADGKGGSVEFSIPAIVAVLRSGGAFQS